jgi:hypothetical protein
MAPLWKNPNQLLDVMFVHLKELKTALPDNSHIITHLAHHQKLTMLQKVWGSRA